MSSVIIKKVHELIEVAKTRPLIWMEIRVVLRYLVAQIIYLNRQCLGVVQNDDHRVGEKGGGG